MKVGIRLTSPPWGRQQLGRLIGISIAVLIVSAAAPTHGEAPPKSNDAGATTTESTDRPSTGDAARSAPWRVRQHPGPLRPDEREAIQTEIAEMLEASQLSDESIGLLAVDLQTGRVLYEHRSDQKMIPASNAKLVTSAAALDVLGPAHTFDTRLYARPDDRAEQQSGDESTQPETKSKTSERPLETAGEVFKGDLAVRGGGEPFLLFEDLVGWAATLRLRGIRKVKGDLIIDDTAFPGDYLPPGFDTKQEDDSFRAPIGAFSVNFNAVTVTVRPADEVGAKPEVTVRPPNDYVRVINRSQTYSGSQGFIEVKSDPLDSNGHPESEGSDATEGSDSMAGGPRTKLVIEGSLGRQSSPWVSRVRIDHPPAFAGSVFREALELTGIEVTGDIRLGTVSDDESPVLSHESRPLAAIVSAMNKWSNNFMAEQILRALGTTREGPATWTQSRTVVESFLSKVGIPPDHYTYLNGSGLYRGSEFKPADYVRLLAFMWNHETSHEFISSLAVAGRSGTLRDRMTESAATGNVRAKTGTLAHVSALSGYLRTQSGRPVAFSMLLNNTPRKAWRYRDLQDRVVTRLAEIDE